MTSRPFVGTGLARVGRTLVTLFLLAAIAGCEDTGKPPPITDLVRPVKTLVLPERRVDAGIELPGRVRAARQLDLAFEKVSGQIVELPIAGREGKKMQKGELLAQIDPRRFETALRKAEDDLGDGYSVLDLARADNERMQKMKGINPELVSASMLARTREKLEQAEARIESLEAEVEETENLLEHSSLRAPFEGIIVRRMVENLQQVRAGEPILSLQDTSHLEVLADAPESMPTAGVKPESISATARFPAAPGESFSLTLKEAVPATDPADPTYRLVFEMPMPKGIELPPGTTGTLSISGKGPGTDAGPLLVPAIAVMTDPEGKSYVWLVDGEQPRVQRRDVQVGRLVGSDRIQVLSGLAGGERIVVAGVMQLTEGRRVRLWEDQAAGKAR